MDTANPRRQPEAERPSPLPGGQAPPPPAESGSWLHVTPATAANGRDLTG
jgi:hypothetical protein